MKIGDTIYYLPTEYSKMYTSGEIIGETSRSWITIPVGTSRDSWVRLEPMRVGGKKVPKSLKGIRLGTKADADLAAWAVANMWSIADALKWKATPEDLLKIAKLICYHDLPKEG